MIQSYITDSEDSWRNQSAMFRQDQSAEYTGQALL